MGLEAKLRCRTEIRTMIGTGGALRPPTRVLLHGARPGAAPLDMQNFIGARLTNPTATARAP
jgi:hypothetical protein